MVNPLNSSRSITADFVCTQSNGVDSTHQTPFSKDTIDHQDAGTVKWIEKQSYRFIDFFSHVYDYIAYKFLDLLEYLNIISPLLIQRDLQALTQGFEQLGPLKQLKIINCLCNQVDVSSKKKIQTILQENCVPFLDANLKKQLVALSPQIAELTNFTEEQRETFMKDMFTEYLIDNYVLGFLLDSKNKSTDKPKLAKKIALETILKAKPRPLDSVHINEDWINGKLIKACLELPLDYQQSIVNGLLGKRSADLKEVALRIDQITPDDYKKIEALLPFLV